MKLINLSFLAGVFLFGGCIEEPTEPDAFLDGGLTLDKKVYQDNHIIPKHSSEVCPLNSMICGDHLCCGAETVRNCFEDCYPSPFNPNINIRDPGWIDPMPWR